MTIQEARKVALLAKVAVHGNCNSVVKTVMTFLEADFPAFLWRYDPEEGDITVEERA